MFEVELTTTTRYRTFTGCILSMFVVIVIPPGSQAMHKVVFRWKAVSVCYIQRPEHRTPSVSSTKEIQNAHSCYTQPLPLSTEMEESPSP
jgi:hypothetical protein